MSRISVIFKPSNRETLVSRGTTVLQAAREAGVEIPTVCSGKGSCGKCRIHIAEAFHVEPPTSSEINLLSRRELEDGYRLACQIVVQDNIVVEIPKSLIRARKFQTDGFGIAYRFQPSIMKRFLDSSQLDSGGKKPIVDMIIGALKKQDLEGLIFSSRAQDLPKVNGQGLTLTISGESIISVEAGDTSGRLYGSAIDIGTSKIVGHLVDLNGGETLAVASVGNPQDVHGEDVISRITSGSPENLAELYDLSVGAVNGVHKSLCSEAGIGASDIYETVIVGNTLMHHLFLGLDPEPLGRAPFEPALHRSLSLASAEAGVSTNPGGLLYLPPLIAGFVGSDAVAGLVATGIYDSEEPAMLVDIGTNTEVFVGGESGLASCSCASGPAFEGGHISHGLKAVAGAIERLSIDPETFDVEYETIDEGKPIGICGSAMIDALAEMWRCGLIDGYGRINLDAKTPRIKAGDERSFVVEWGESTDTGRDITLTQRDIEELLLAKAAVYSACSVMLRRRGLGVDEISGIYVAGAFGSSIDAENVVVIGMLPDVEPERIVFAGNTAVSGAKAMLTSKTARNIAEELPLKIVYHELSLDPDFNMEYLNALFIPHKDQGRFPSVRRYIDDQ